MCTGMDLSACFVVKSTICTLSSRTRFAWPPAQGDRMELLPMFDGIMFVALESTACALPSRWAAGVPKSHFVAPGPWGRSCTHMIGIESPLSSTHAQAAAAVRVFEPSSWSAALFENKHVPALQLHSSAIACCMAVAAARCGCRTAAGSQQAHSMHHFRLQPGVFTDPHALASAQRLGKQHSVKHNGGRHRRGMQRLPQLRLPSGCATIAAGSTGQNSIVLVDWWA